MPIENIGSVVWFGNVVDRVDPENAGRLKVRIIGVHGDNIGDDMLPWALVSQPITSAATQGVGSAPVGVLVGTQVWGFFLDGQNKQMPIINGSIGGISDVNPIAYGTSSLDKGTGHLEPASQYAAAYPYNKTTTTEGGHVIEVDDTPGAERIHVYHKAGSYYEMNPDGSVVTRTTGDSFDIVMKDKTISVAGDLKVVIAENATIQVGGEANILVEGALSAMSETAIKIQAPVISILELDTPLDLDVARNQSHVQQNGILVLFDDEIPQGGSVDSTLLAEFPSPPVSNTPSESGDTAATARPSRRVSCLDLQITGNSIPRGSPLYNTKLSRNFTLGSMTTNTVLSKTAVRAQNGISADDLVCNLKAVAENILEPVRARYPGFNINSGLRAGAGRSQHLRGQAVDLQWPGKSNREMFEMAKWISRNLPVDQLIVEHGRRLWLHISYNRTASSQRGKLTTMINNRYTNGLSLHY